MNGPLHALIRLLRLLSGLGTAKRQSEGLSLDEVLERLALNAQEAPELEPATAPRLAKRRRRHLPRATALLLATLTMLIASAAGVFAYFISQGNGTASASVGNLNPPTSVSATATAGSGTVPVTWTASSTVNGVTPEGYYVLRYSGSTPSAACGTSLTSLTTGTTCNDLSVPDGTYTYTVVAKYHSWTAESAPSSAVTVVNDNTAPATTITFPPSGTYNALSWAAGCAPSGAGICGTASDSGRGNNGVTSVEVSIKNSAGAYWTGSSFSGVTETFNAVTAGGTASGAGTANWFYSFTPPADDSYTVHVRATDTIPNTTQPGFYTATTFTYDTAGPSIAREVVADATANTAGFITQGGGYYAYAQVTDTGSGVSSVTADVQTTTTGAASVAMATAGGPWTIGAQSYNYRSSLQTANGSLPESGNPYGFAINASDVASNTSSANGNVSVDNTGPSGGTVDATGLVGTGPRYSTSTTLHIAFTTGSDAGVGLAASGFQLLRAQGTLSSSDSLVNGSCSSYGSFSQVGANDPGSPVTDSTGITTAHCYQYEYVVKDKLGNQTTYAGGDVKVDTTAPTAGTITANGGNTYNNSSTVALATSGFGDPQSGISSTSITRATATLSGDGCGTLTGSTPVTVNGGGNDGATLTTGCYRYTFTVTNNAGSSSSTQSATIKVDLAAPTGGSITANGGATYNKSGTVSISTTAFSDAETAVASTSITRAAGTLSGDNCGTLSGSSTVTVSGGNDNASLATGCYQYTFTGTDKAGNSTSRQSGIVKVDRGAPTGGSISANGGNTYNNTGTISISTGAFTDAETAVASTSITRATGTLSGDGCGTLSGSTTVTVSGGNDNASLAAGCYQYTFTATDKAGNTGSTTSNIVKVDLAAPTGGTITANGGATYNNTGTVSVTTTAFSDAQTGVASTAITRASATLTNGSCGTLSGSTTVTVSGGNDNASLATGCYQYTFTGTDKAGNSTSRTSAVVQVDLAATSANALSITSPTNSFFATPGGTNTLFYKGNAAAGSFILRDAVTDGESGPASATFPAIGATGWTHANQTVSSGTGSAPTITYSSSAYSWTTANPSVPADQTITGKDLAGNTSTATLHFVSDTTIQTAGTLTVNGTAASGAGTGSTTTSTGFTIGARTDYSESLSATQSGLVSSILTIQSATLSSGTCGSAGSGGPFTTATTISGTTQPVGIQAGFCYVYTLTGTDNVGNTTSISTTVKVFTSPTVTSANAVGQGATNWPITVTGTGFVNGAGLSAAVSGTGVTVVSTTFVNSTTLTVNLTVASNATLTARNITVTNPDGGTGTGTGVLTIDAGPTVTSPTSASPCNPGHNGTANCSITGTGFVSGVTVTISAHGSVNSVTFNSSTSLTINVTGSGGSGQTGNLTVTNPDGGSVTVTNGFSNG